MSHVISQKFQSPENLSLISGSIVDVMTNFRNITKQAPPVLYRANLSEYNSLSEKIRGFSNLQHNWDSYNADAVSKNAIYTAIETLNHLNSKGQLTNGFSVNVFPMRDGGIQFEFDGENMIAELEISLNGELTLIYFDDEGNVIGEPQELFELSELSTLLEEAQYA